MGVIECMHRGGGLVSPWPSETATRIRIRPLQSCPSFFRSLLALYTHVLMSHDKCSLSYSLTIQIILLKSLLTLHQSFLSFSDNKYMPATHHNEQDPGSISFLPLTKSKKACTSTHHLFSIPSTFHSSANRASHIQPQNSISSSTSKHRQPVMEF